MKGFWISLGLTFWAEMGDKTQLLALAYATRYPLADVLIGIFFATAAVHLVSVGLGHFIALWLPPGILQAIAALSFLIFGIWTLLEKEEEGVAHEAPRHPILLVTSTIFLAELGDKTMLTAVTLAATWGWFTVWLATTAGMVLSDGLAVFVGRAMGKKIPASTIRWVAALLFFGCAIWSGSQAIRLGLGARN